MKKKITMYHGQECPHCQLMHPIADRLIKEGYPIEKFEVWHDEKNADEMRKYSEIISEACGGGLGVPAFIDKVGNRAMCGENTYEDLKKWIDEK